MWFRKYHREQTHTHRRSHHITAPRKSFDILALYKSDYYYYYYYNTPQLLPRAKYKKMGETDGRTPDRCIPLTARRGQRVTSEGLNRLQKLGTMMELYVRSVVFAVDADALGVVQRHRRRGGRRALAHQALTTLQHAGTGASQPHRRRARTGQRRGRRRDTETAGNGGRKCGKKQRKWAAGCCRRRRRVGITAVKWRWKRRWN